MAKRFTDTDKYKKAFIRSLPGAYKLLWDYMYHDCDHAGIWHKDFQIAQIYLGSDMPINEADAIKYFNNGKQRIQVLNEGSKWFIRPFVSFQYGDLNPENRLHSSVLSILSKEGIKPLASPLEGAKDKDKDKNKERGSVRGFDEFWKMYPRKVGKGAAEKKWADLKITDELKIKILKAIENQRGCDQWTKDGGRFIPHPSTWLNQRRWEDELGDNGTKPNQFQKFNRLLA
jgi:hypothetical protein